MPANRSKVQGAKLSSPSQLVNWFQTCLGRAKDKSFIYMAHHAILKPFARLMPHNVVQKVDMDMAGQEQGPRDYRRLRPCYEYSSTAGA